MEKALPNNWVSINLKESVDFRKGKKPKMLSSEYFEGSVPYMDIQGLEKGIISYYADSNSAKYFKDNDVVIVWDGSRSGLILKPSDGAIGSTLGALSPIGYNTQFLYYFLSTHYEIINSKARGVGIPHVDPTYLWNLELPLPPLAEQQRIVAKLNTLFGQVALMKKSLNRIPQLLKDFRQQVLTQAVTGKLTEEWRKEMPMMEWKVKSFGELILGTPKNGAYYPQHLYGQGVKIIRIDNFYNGVLKNWDSLKSVLAPKEDVELYRIYYNDIIINRVNSIQYLGKCLLFKEHAECIYESNMMKVTVDNLKIIPAYAKVYLTSQIGLKELRKNAKHAVNQASINQTDVKNVRFNVPTLAEQEEIVLRVESSFTKASKIETLYQKLKEKLDALPQTILNKAFKGELVEQLTTDGDAKDLLEEIKRLKIKK